MAHELYDSSLFDENIALYEELKEPYRNLVDNLESIDRLPSNDLLSNPVANPFIDSMTSMRLSNIEFQRRLLKLDREREVSKASLKITLIEYARVLGPAGNTKM